MARKRKRKVKLPVDRNGVPIRVGDVIAWSDMCFKVQSMTWYGDVGSGLGWTIEGEPDTDEWSDNPSSGKVVFKGGKHV